MKWVKDQYTDNFLCPFCNEMVRDNGYGGCDYKFCPGCGRDVEPTQKEETSNE